MSRFVGGGYLLYFFVSLPVMGTQATLVASWWTPMAIVLAFVPGWALLAVTFFKAAESMLRVLPMCCGAGYLASVGLWFIAWNRETVPNGNATWLILFPGLASLAIVLGPRPWLSIPHLACATAAAFAANHFGTAQGGTAWMVGTAVMWSISFSALFVIAGLMAVRTGDVLDATRERTHRIAAEAAAREAREAERIRYDDLVHDRILAVMLAVERQPSNPAVAAYARRVMAELAEPLENDIPLADQVDVEKLLRATVTRLDPTATVTIAASTTRSHQLFTPPHNVIHAVIDATAEAVGNSVRHAGSHGRTSVTASSSADAVHVLIRDDGPGFDADAVPPNRLGITRGIRQRMARAGGSGTVTSHPDVGTTVELRWPAE